VKRCSLVVGPSCSTIAWARAGSSAATNLQQCAVQIARRRGLRLPLGARQSHLESVVERAHRDRAQAIVRSLGERQLVRDLLAGLPFDIGPHDDVAVARIIVAQRRLDERQQRRAQVGVPRAVQQRNGQRVALGDLRAAQSAE